MKFSEMPYTRVDMEAVKDRMMTLIANAKNARSGEELFENHRKYYKLTGEVETMWTIASIRHGIDTTDPFYEAEHDFYDEAGPLFQNLMQTYARTLYESPFRPYMEEKIGKVAFKNIEIALKSFDEKLIPMLQEENALTTRYMKLMANVKIEFNGETCNLTRMRVYQTHQDRSIRKAATKALSDYFLSVTDELDEIYDKLVKNRTAQARALGYENYVQLGYYRMGRNDYCRADVERFRKQVKESFVPFVSKINAARTARLGIFDPKFYDAGVFFNEGNPDPVGTPEEILESGRKMYHELSPETAEFIDFMLENELFDVLGRPNKQQGGYMTFLPVYKAPFIFANFNGTSADVDVITHECGHAFQGFLMRDEEIREYGDIGMETAEIHSMSMEYFTYGWMQSFFGDRYRDYLKMHFEDSCTFVPYGCMVDEFQHIVYENPDMTPAERKQVWAELEKSYRPDIDFDGDPFFGQGGYWQRQQHIFNSPFYYIDYVLASVCAMQFKVRMDEDFEGAWKTYLKLCRFAARDFYRNMLADAGLDSPFAEGTVEKLVNALETRL
ncbi:MAG: M3 family oligoendopeptidase [Lachnospiraceae bacterium]|nr:M3 family oligoendopeptidase [Lachnospiraceae bacterium]